MEVYIWTEQKTMLLKQNSARKQAIPSRKSQCLPKGNASFTADCLLWLRNTGTIQVNYSRFCIRRI